MGAIEDMLQIVFRVTDERDAAHAEVKQLKQALHDARLENSENIQSLNQTARKFNVALNEVEQLKQALHDARLENSGQAARIEELKRHIGEVTEIVRPEPSRLEIAAMMLQGLLPMHVNSTDVDVVALKLADRLIAAAKEGK